MADDAAPPAIVAEAPKKHPNYTAVFAAELIELARTDRRIVGITAGMPTGTGMARFQAEYPDRMFDVGIAEQHAMTMATGLAMGGMRPVVALYSTFLQRAFDQTVHDVCQNDQPVLIAVDRAGLVGEDGTSHQGMFTLAAQRQLPNLVIASPRDEQELRSLLHTALNQDHPFALHYPRDAGFGLEPVVPAVIPVGRGEVLREGRDLLFVGFGPIVARALEAAETLEAEGWSIGVINARYARPLGSPADPRPGSRQAPGRHLRGERRHRRVWQWRARADRGGAPGGSGLPRGRRADRWHPRGALRRSRLRCGPATRCFGSMRRACRPGPRVPGTAARDPGPLRGRRRLIRLGYAIPRARWASARAQMAAPPAMAATTRSEGSGLPA